MKNKGIILAGNLIVDALKDIDVYPEHSKLTTIRGVHKSIGGLVCNCACDLARLDADLPIYAVGVMGDDDYGKYIRESFSVYPNIDISNIRIAGETSFTDAMCDMTNRTRTFFTFRGASSLLSPEDFDFDKLDGDLLHAGYMLLLDGLDAPDEEYGTAMARVLADAQRHGIRTSVDVVSEESDRYRTVVLPALKYTDYCIINETEASRITGIDVLCGDTPDEAKIKSALIALFDLGVSRYAVVHSRDRSYGMSKDGEFYSVPSINIPRELIKGTTGAGDAFCSGILYAIERDMPLEEAMVFATAVATSSLLSPGASDGIMSYDDTLTFGRDCIDKYGTV